VRKGRADCAMNGRAGAAGVPLLPGGGGGSVAGPRPRRLAGDDAGA
jgi:hypothetical protein